ncbi:hypothetical protein CHS0354_025217 [Potamilus streckersoni]|uniref:DUF7042 domain-containing protein n=1 Tax=Potamilus streckersoni TaxID=2493646 RepID=A0AAE0RNA0_9BIVA|nr:hypothetical protein CHS0354_025217 [Potamilus streckersoni]
MAYSGGGNVWCVASVISGYTYVMVYNNDTNVDYINTYRFTCFAISSDGRNASMVPQNCSEGQTPFNFAKSTTGLDAGAKLTMSAYVAEGSTVDLPVDFQNSSWYDGTKGKLIFSNKTMTGWNVTVFGHTVSAWELIGNNFDTDDYLIFRLTDTISGSVPYYAYLCMKPTRISNYSYYYYQVHAKEASAEGDRILLSTDKTLRNKDQICDSANMEPTEQFHIIVKSGYEQNARQDCPNPLRGKFKYVYYGISVNVACDFTNGELDVCSNIQIMSFNYSQCSQQVAYTANGTAWCMASVTSGHSFTIVYNADSNVDDNSTFRFSCIAVSSDRKNASVVPKNCRENQTPYSFGKAQNGSTIGSKLTMKATDTCESTSGPYSYCVFPSQFMNSVWHDSTKGNLTFTNTTMSGWSFMTYGHTVTNWKCWDSTLFETQGYLVMKLADTISAQTTKFAYMCMKMTKLSNNSYYYYLVQAQSSTAGEERILISDNDTMTDIGILCDANNIEPKEQFHVLIKSGFEVEAREDCPNAVRGNFDYTYYGSDGSVKCQFPNDQWTVCQDNKTMIFNYSTCSQKIAYSSGGIAWCVASIVGTNTYVMVYNNDSFVDNVNTFRFTCFAVLNDGTSASMTPRNCTENQSPTVSATSQNGSKVGALLTMTAYGKYLN